MTPPTGTTAEDYSKRYYTHYSDTDESYDWTSTGWRDFFRMVARRTVEAVGPVETALDVGCAKGMLVQALSEVGVDAKGFDLSPVSVEASYPDVRERLWVASATDPIQGRYDLVTCIEVLEHLSAVDAHTAIDHICSVTDRVIMSSTPGDFTEPTHVNVHPLADWVAAFASRGFYRRVDVDLGFIAPWAICLERANLTTRDLAHRYESDIYPMTLEIIAKRQALLEAHRELARMDSGEATAELRDQLARTRHELLLLRDHVIGREAAVATARVEVARLEHELAAVRHDLEAVRNSQRWRVGGAIVAPASAVKRRTRR